MTSLKEKLTCLLELSTAHGLPNIIRSKYLLVKVLWFLSLALSTSACVYFLYYSLFNYFEHEYVTKVIKVEDPRPDFPAVSFCINSTNQSIKDVIIYSSFNNEGLKYNSSDYVTIQSYFETCFRFNSLMPLKKALIPDISSGLFLLMYTNSSYLQYLKALLFVQNSSTLFGRFKGFSKETGELLPAGITIVKINREIVQNLPQPYNECIKQDTDEYVSELFQYFIRNNVTYTQSDCTDLCAEELLYKKCNCTVEFGKIMKCLEKDPECVKAYIKESYDKIFSEKCLKKCPLECDSMNYVINSNFIGKPNYEFLSYFLEGKKLNTTNLPNEVVGIYVYYSDLNYKLISQIPKTTSEDLISNLGGTLGLFLGVSFLSFIELVEILIESLIHLRNTLQTKSIHSN